MSRKTHRVLVIGVGSIGERHLRCFQATGRAELSLCEINPTLRRDVAERYGVEHACETLDAAMEDLPEAAVVAVPAHLHIAMSTRLARAGVHLLIEKPLSTAVDGMDELFETVRRQNLVAGLAYVLRMHPALSAMKQALDTGRFGKPVQLYGICGQHFPTFRPAYRETYYVDRATGGGAVQDAITHILNAGEWLVGPIDRLVAECDIIAFAPGEADTDRIDASLHGNALEIARSIVKEVA